VKRPRVDNELDIHEDWKGRAAIVFAEFMSISSDPKYPPPLEEASSRVLTAMASLENGRAIFRHLKSLVLNATPETWFYFDAAIVNATWGTAGAVPDQCPLHETCFQIKRCSNDCTAFRHVSPRQ
jgi:hypothetical protein